MIEVLEFIRGLLEFILEPIYEAILARFGQNRTEFDERMETLVQKERDFKVSNAMYNQTILSHFVKRRFRTYGGGTGELKIRRILAKIEGIQWYNLFLTGEAGMGKTTALKWLYLHVRLKKPPIFLYAIEFKACADIDSFFQELAKKISGEDKDGAVVFLDGLDELNCLRGTPEEFQRIAEQLNIWNSGESGAHRFVISSRPEHFQFRQNLLKKPESAVKDSYIFCEILPLNRKEMIGVCKSIKFLAKNEREILPHARHFANKYPQEKREERKYLQGLRHYLRATGGENSLLSSPLLCRYAYPIVKEWSADKNVGASTTQTAHIRNTLGYCIKWEYHDHVKESTDSELGRKALEQYVRRVKDFLSVLASHAESNGAIPRAVWDELKQREEARADWELNAAYCVLREDENVDALYFIHRAFSEFFLARFYASGLGNRESEELARLIRDRDEFASIYAELLMTDGEGDTVSQNVCNSLLATARIRLSRKDQHARLVKYAKGDTYLEFEGNAEDLSFTVQDFLRVFPHSSAWYMGIEWNRAELQKTLSDGILKLVDAKEALELGKYRANKLADEDSIRGVKLMQSGFYNLDMDFTCIDGGAEYNLNTAFVAKALSDEEKRKLNDPDARKVFDMRSYAEVEADQALLNNRRFNAIRFLGEDKCLWCLFWKGELYVYEDSSLMESVLNEMREQKFGYFLFTYGHYRAFCGVSPRTFQWMKMEDVSVSLNQTPVRGIKPIEKSQNFMSAVERDASLVKSADFHTRAYVALLFYYYSVHASNYSFSEVLTDHTSEVTFGDSILKSNFVGYLQLSLEMFHRSRYLLFPDVSVESPKDEDIEEKHFVEVLEGEALAALLRQQLQDVQFNHETLNSEALAALLRLYIKDKYLMRYPPFSNASAKPSKDEDIEEKLYVEALDKDEQTLLRLHIGDEYLITYYFLSTTGYLLGERDAMYRFAVETIPLCEQYGHLDGVKLRRLLLDDRRKLIHSMERFQWIRDYVRNYLWI